MQRVSNGVLHTEWDWRRQWTAVCLCRRPACLVSAHAHARAGAVLVLVLVLVCLARLRHVHRRRAGLQAWHWVDRTVTNGSEPLVEAAQDGSPVVHRSVVASVADIARRRAGGDAVQLRSGRVWYVPTSQYTAVALFRVLYYTIV